MALWRGAEHGSVMFHVPGEYKSLPRGAQTIHCRTGGQTIHITAAHHCQLPYTSPPPFRTQRRAPSP